MKTPEQTEQISIIVPTYNHGNALLRTLQSIQAQTYANWELIIVDDGSTDNTKSLVRDWQSTVSQEQKITYHYQENSGAPTARNRGAAEASGQYLLFCDADIIMAPTMLEELLGALRNHPEASYAYSDFRFGWKRFRGRPFDTSALRFMNYIHTTTLIRREVFSGFDESLPRFQDWDLWLTMTEAGHQGLWVPKLLFRAQITREGISKWKPRGWYAFFRRFPSLAPKDFWRYEEAKRRIYEKHFFTPPTLPRTKLAVVIVAWNVVDDVRRCLAALQPMESDFTIVVVDNASSDGTAEMVMAGFPNVRLIRNTVNAGFARACNQGARAGESEYIVFLNPDTIPEPSALKQLVEFFDNQPAVGILGPKLKYADGRTQWSTRRFPTLLPTSLILLKIYLLFPRLRSLRRYLMSAFQHETLRQVDQVMGACLMIRRSLFEKLQGFDERFYIWFEEVDLCKRAAAAGALTMFYPQAEVQHGSSHSFSQRNLLWKQWHFAKSARRYFAKHANPLSAIIVATISYLSLVPVLLATPFTSIWQPKTQTSKHKPYINWKHWTALFLLAYLLSFLAHYIPSAGPPTYMLMLGGFAILAYYYFSTAVLVAMAELFIGSHGYLVSTTFFGIPLSLRLGLFVILQLVFLLRYLQLSRDERKRTIIALAPIILFLLVVAAGVLQGYYRGYDLQTIFLDANAYLFILIAAPLWLAFQQDKTIGRQYYELLLVASVYLSALTLISLYIFTHRLPGFQIDFYQWLRDTRLAELTPTATGAYRIFFPSQLYVIIAWLLVVLHSTWHKVSFSLRHVIFLITTTAAVLVSFSRSFWLGWIAAAGVYFLMLLYRNIKDALWAGVSMTGIGAASFLLVIGVLLIPYPAPSSTGSLEVQERFDFYTEQAASSRWNLLPPLLEATKERAFLGAGFGSTVTYVSNDPRVRALYSDGRYTTTAFEWGYLDIILKIGLLGLGVYLWIITQAGRALLRSYSLTKNPLTLGWLFGLLAVLVVHASSPYLNHPLGFGFIAFLFASAASCRATIDKPNDT